MHSFHSIDAVRCFKFYVYNYKIMKRKSCVSAFSRRLSEADIRNRITRNTPAKPLHNLSSTKNNPKTATSELRKDPTIIIGYKLNNFTT